MIDTATQSDVRVYRVPEENLAKLQTKIAKLAKRATKLGLPAPSIALGEVEIVRHKKEISGVETVRTYQHLTLAGTAIVKLNGWELAAVVSPVADEEGKIAGNILRAVPGASTIPEVYRNVASACDHCKTSRRRLETFLVVNEGGEWKQIGRNCLRDFLGHVSAEAYADYAQLLLDAGDFAEGAESFDLGVRIETKWDIDDILAHVVSTIRLHGWRSRKTAELNGGTSTSNLVHEWITYTGNDRDKHFEFNLSPTPEDVAKAAEVVAWLATLSERGDLNDYMHNLSLLGRVRVVTGRNLGILAAAVATWAKELEREINRRKRFEADTNSKFVGEVGKRIFFVATLVYTNSYENDWGVSHLYKMKTPEGDIISTFASNQLWTPISGDFKLGETIRLKGTVKKHEERGGVKGTLMTRVVLGIEPTKEQKKTLTKLGKVLFALQTSKISTGLTEWEYDNVRGEAIGIISEIKKNVEGEVERTALVKETIDES